MNRQAFAGCSFVDISLRGVSGYVLIDAVVKDGFLVAVLDVLSVEASIDVEKRRFSRGINQPTAALDGVSFFFGKPLNLVTGRAGFCFCSFQGALPHTTSQVRTVYTISQGRCGLYRILYS